MSWIGPGPIAEKIIEHMQGKKYAPHFGGRKSGREFHKGEKNGGIKKRTSKKISENMVFKVRKPVASVGIRGGGKGKAWPLLQ